MIEDIYKDWSISFEKENDLSSQLWEEEVGVG